MRTREIKMKPYRVTDPSGRIHIAYAKTSAGAIAATQESLRESWSAEPADAEDLYHAAKNGEVIVNAPESMRDHPAQLDAFGEG